jgi:hypothetical protein
VPRLRQPVVQPMTQTTVRFPQPLLKRARIRAAVDEITLQALLVEALDAELSRREKKDERRQAAARRRRSANGQ